MIVLWCTVRCLAQNAVANGDFEQYSQCPDYVSQIDRASGWSRPTEGTSDYYNACLGVPFSMNVPDNQMGDQVARSGHGYAGLYAFYENSGFEVQTNPYREYMTHALNAPLVPGNAYRVAFHISLADVSKYAVKDLGALFTTAVPHRDDDHVIAAMPQVTNGSGDWLSDKDGWTTIEGCFIADSAYAYITIGHFVPPENTAFLEVETQYPLIWFSYYYVDDIEVHPILRPQLGPDVVVCDATSLEVLDPQDDIAYHWSTGEEGTGIVVDSSGVYTVTALTNGGCALMDTVVVSILPRFPLELDSVISNDFCLVHRIDLDTGPLPTDDEAYWSTGDTGRICPVIAPGLYTVTVSGADHCPANATIRVINSCEEGLFIPNAFTPGADGQNDVWRPVWLRDPDARMHLRIFDRWGAEVLELDAQHPAWDGTMNGSPSPVGIYAWHLRIQDSRFPTERVFMGHVTLLR